tara:strand:+ start:21009 stop:22160 length:1152 start_codon:yes stop_codon:yes gene_type:complete
MKLVLVFISCICVTIFPIKNAIASYILDDIKSNVYVKSRTQYAENDSTQWNQYSNVLLNVSFPKIDTYLDVKPHLEFGHFYNHSNPTSESMTRLTEAYVDAVLPIGILSFGEKRFSLNGGRFISDATFNLLPRTFQQISYMTPNNNIQFSYLKSTSASNSTQKHFYSNGSYIINANHLTLMDLIDINAQVFLFEDISNTYSITFSKHFNGQHLIESTVSYQTNPYNDNHSFYSSSRIFHDAIYKYSFNNQSFRLGTRFFEGPQSSTPGFSAPYSSGHAWDGYVSTYMSSIQNGFSEDFRSIFGSFSTQLNQTQFVNIHGYLFRGQSLTKNLGAEIDLCIQDELIKNRLFWVYKVGQFIPGIDSPAPSELKMWLDFVAQLGPIN